MNRTFLLPTRPGSGDESGFDNRTVAVVNITPDLARLIVARAHLLEEAAAKDDQLWELYFWDDAPTYHAISENDLTKKQREKLEDDERLVLRSDPLEHVPAENTEVDQMILRNDGTVSWTAMPKHVDIYEVTATIPIFEIRCLVTHTRKVSRTKS